MQTKNKAAFKHSTKLFQRWFIAQMFTTELNWTLAGVIVEECLKRFIRSSITQDEFLIPLRKGALNVFMHNMKKIPRDPVFNAHDIVYDKIKECRKKFEASAIKYTDLDLFNAVWTDLLPDMPYQCVGLYLKIIGDVLSPTIEYKHLGLH